MDYKLLRGEFVIHNPNNPNQGPEPDGDTIRFVPEDTTLLHQLAQRSGTFLPSSIKNINIRLEAIDALETHFPVGSKKYHQELKGAEAARDDVLRQLGFTNVIFSGNKVKSVDQPSLPGWVLSNGVDKFKRLIGFIYKEDDLFGADGSTVVVDEEIVGKSVNAALLAAGFVYPAFYDTLPETLREPLAVKSKAARNADEGLWPRSKASPDVYADDVVSIQTLQSLVIWPKLFRRVVSFMAPDKTSLTGFKDWLLEKPAERNDELTLVGTGEKKNLDELIIVESDSSIKLTVFPEDVVVKSK